MSLTKTSEGNAPSFSTSTLSSLGAALTKEVLENTGSPSVERCGDIVDSIQFETAQTTSKRKGEGRRSVMTIATLDRTKIGKALSKSVKAFKRHRRTASGSEERGAWDALIGKSEGMLTAWKRAVEMEERKNLERKGSSPAAGEPDATTGLPSTVGGYKSRLERQKKELYKDPPVLPPPKVDVDKTWVDPPTRKKNGQIIFRDFPEFTPNRTPEEVLRAGSFGGTYFRSIVSAVTNVKYRPDDVLSDTVEPGWIKGLDKRMMLTSQTYRAGLNKYGVKCGGSLGMWESSGWIADCDPYGWFQWYCRFYRGRRCDDDDRQISRWAKSAGPRGRFRSQLCNKCLAAGKKADDSSISPVIRQTLLHWGFELTDELLEKHRKSKKM